MEDAPKMPHEVYAAFVLSSIGKGDIDSIDAKTALVINSLNTDHIIVYKTTQSIFLIHD